MNRLTRGFWQLMALVVVVGCQDVAAPAAARAPTTLEADKQPPPPKPKSKQNTGADIDLARVLVQGDSVPSLTTYQVSFWASRDRATNVVVRYAPVNGQTVGAPFLAFEIPKGSVKRHPNGQDFKGRDSVLITMTIDTVHFLVDFEPSGLQFDNGNPALLAFFYENADPDLNGDGVVNATDDSLRHQLAIVYQTARHQPWWKNWSWNDPAAQFVIAPIYHYSQYAVSW
ncbi:MAG TPA: hypothetical protein VEV39_14800 [Gemmatimonadales bacterium]|nr:hypothetical protein [Gemmatimonadales bacterium]